MKNFYRPMRCSAVLILLLAPVWAWPRQQERYLDSQEVEQLRDAQEPSQRIKLYLMFAQKRLNRMDGLRDASPQAQPNLGAQLDELLGEFISIDDELKDWIQYQYDRDTDMRPGLRLLLKEAPQQLQQLQHIQNSPGPAARDYTQSLHDAIADLQDTIDGATQAFAAQEKKFPQMKQDEKAQRRALKQARKEERRLNKKERKLNKKERKLREKQQKKQGSGDD